MAIPGAESHGEPRSPDGGHNWPPCPDCWRMGAQRDGCGCLITQPEEIVPLTRTMKTLAALLDSMDKVMADDLILNDEND